MFEDIYKTIEKPCEGIYKDRGSKFLAFAFPVQSEQQVKDILKDLRKQYYDARHHCYAYCLGAEKAIYRINDDGEPSGTAGKPIFGQIQSHDLTDILIVVVRYFGGTLLGVRGLIDAYKGAASDALQKATIITKYIKEMYAISFEYTLMNEVMRILKQDTVEITGNSYENTCRLDFLVRKSCADKIVNQLKSLNNLKIQFLKTC